MPTPREIYCTEVNCRHFTGTGLFDEDVRPRFEFYCTAFPNGIPKEICEGAIKHKVPLPNQDNDIVFESIETTTSIDESDREANLRKNEAPWAEQYRRDLKELQKTNPEIDFIGGDGSPRSDRDRRK